MAMPGMRIGKLLVKPFAKSIFLKWILIHTLLITVTISVSGFIIIRNLSDVLQDKEIQFEKEALKKLQNFTEDEYKKIFKIVFQMNYPGGVGDVIAKAGHLQGKLYSDDYSVRQIKDYLSTISSYDDKITDFIVISNDHSVFYDTGLPKQSRTALASYPFLEDKWISEAIENKEFIKVFRDNPSRYLNKDSDDVISFVGNIYNPAHIEKKQSVGAYIINVSLSKFLESYSEYESSVKGDFVIFNTAGNVLFSSDKNFVMDRESSYYSNIKPVSGKSDEVELFGKRYLYHQSSVGSTPLLVANLIPKDLLWEYVKTSILKISYVLLASLMAVVLLMSFVIYMYSNRMKLLIRHMDKVKQGNFTTRIRLNSDDEFGKLADAFNDMSEKLNQYIRRVYDAEIEMKTAELSALQAQVNPHFLYNTLESIRMQALQEQKPKIASMISLLGNLFRWSVKAKSKIVEVEQEIYYVTTYLELQKTRFSDKLEFEIQVDNSLLNMGIPKLLLQPLVENAFVHGIGETQSRLSIRIEGTIKDNEAIFTIRDNGVGIDEEALEKIQKQIAGIIEDDDNPSNRIGIANVSRRIKLIFGNHYGLQIHSVKLVGTSIILNFPAMSAKEMQAYVQGTDRG